MIWKIQFSFMKVKRKHTSSILNNKFIHFKELGIVHCSMGVTKSSLLTFQTFMGYFGTSVQDLYHEQE